MCPDPASAAVPGPFDPVVPEANRQLFTTEPTFIRADQALAPWLVIDGPSAPTLDAQGDVVTAPGDRKPRLQTQLSFTRTREVPVRWDALPAGATEDLSYLGRYLLRSWGYEAGGYPADPTAHVAELDATSPRWAAVRSLGRTPAAPDGDTTWETRRVEAGFAVRHGRAGAAVRREYLVLPRVGATLAAADFADRAAWEAAWATKVGGIELCARAEADAPRVFAFGYELSLAPQAIRRQMKELLILESLAAHLAGAADKLKDAIDALALSREDLDNLTAKYVDFKLRPELVEQAKVALADRARDLGFYLCIRAGDQKPVPGQPPKLLVPGELYRIVEREFSWTTHHEHRFRFWFWEVRVPYAVEHRERGLDFVDVEVDVDPWVEEEEALRGDGLSPHRFQLTDRGYETSGGLSLEQLMARCDADEATRASTAVLLPVYEPKLTSGMVLTRYLVFRRPLKGMAVVGTPRVFLEESLAYRMGWKGCELGQLLHTINLGPGEERVIQVTKTFTQETEVKRSTTSLLDLTETQSQDLSSEIEHQARQEDASSSSVNWNVKASGGLGFFSASAEVGGSSSWSQKRFAQHLDKVARKASSSLMRKTRQEVASSVSTRTSVSNAESTQIRLRNVNQGRTLNLLFYQLANVFRTGLYMEDLRFVVLTAEELIEGTGIRAPSTFVGTAVRPMLEALRLDALLEGHGDPTAAKEKVLDAVLEVLRDDYDVADGSGTSAKTLRLPDAGTVAQRVRAVLAAPRAAGAHAAAATAGAAGAGLEEKILRLERTLGEARADGKPVEGSVRDLSTPSSGLYAESVVGVRAATEPYSEEMRRQEIRLKAASVYKEQAEGLVQEARARALADLPTALPDASLAPALVIEKVVLKNSVAPGVSHALAVFLSGKLPFPAETPARPWTLWWGAAKVADVDAGWAGASVLLLTWAAPPPWWEAYAAVGSKDAEFALRLVHPVGWSLVHAKG